MNHLSITPQRRHVRPYVSQAYIPTVRHTVMKTSPSVRQSYTTSDHHPNATTSQSVCQSRQSSVRRTVEPTSPSICQAHDTSVRHAMITKSPSVCPSAESSDCHTTSKTSLSIYQSRNVIPTSLSGWQSPDSSVCYPTRDARHAVCSSSITSVLPSANPTVKIPTSIPVRNPFPYYHVPG